MVVLLLRQRAIFTETICIAAVEASGVDRALQGNNGIWYTECPKTFFDVLLNIENSDIMNGLPGNILPSREPNLILDTRILPISRTFTELQAFEVQVSAKAETRGPSIAVTVTSARGYCFCFSLTSDRTK